MAINYPYDPSQLTEGETLYEELIKIRRYLDKNPIYKIYNSLEDASVLIFEYDLDLVQLPEGQILSQYDVVLFQNDLYAIVETVNEETRKYTVSSIRKIGGDTDLQEQIDQLKKSIAGNVEGIAHLNELKLDKNECTIQFNQLFNTNTSTLPSANGLTITNIFGGHHIEGTTTSQYYHKMYSINTINGHQYYFAANFSDTANVYIVGKIDSTSFNTKDEKLFVGGDNFNITLQIERDNTINTDLKPILIDLTEMFGIGNEPQTIQELHNYIVKDAYYPHTTKLTDSQYESIGEIDAIKGIALDNQANKANQSEVTELASQVNTNANKLDKISGGGNYFGSYQKLCGLRKQSTNRVQILKIFPTGKIKLLKGEQQIAEITTNCRMMIITAIDTVIDYFYLDASGLHNSSIGGVTDDSTVTVQTTSIATFEYNNY